MHPDPDKGVKIDLPIQWEEANDDANDEDESWFVTSGEHMYSIDAPGIKPSSPFVHAKKWWVEDTFYEYMRVSFGDQPDGNGVKGGQCSGNIGWHSFTTIQWDTFDSKWVRVDPNEISRVFVNIDDVPPEN